MMPKIKTRERFLLKGQFKGKYYGYLDELHSDAHQREYGIYIYEGSFLSSKPGKDADYEGVISNGNSYKLIVLNDILIKSSPDEKGNTVLYRVKPAELWAENVSLIQVQKEGNTTYGTLVGDAIVLVDEHITYEALGDPTVFDPLLEEKPKVTKPIPPREKVTLAEIISGIQLIFGALIVLALVINFVAAIVSVIDWVSLGYLILIGLAIWGLRWVFYPVLMLLRYLFQSILLLIFLGAFFVSLIGNYVTNAQNESSPLPEPNVLPSSTLIQTEVHNDSTTRSYVEHLLKWQDYQQQEYEGKIRIYTEDYLAARSWREGLASQSTFEDWPEKVFYRLAKRDKELLGFYFQQIDSIQQKNNLAPKPFAELLVSMIQEIPYVLLEPGVCPTQNSFPCEDQVSLGIHTPLEFLYSLKGDCDTRALLLYLSLKHYGYDVILLGSNRYQHALIGINLPYRGTFYSLRGKRYYLWETTAKGWQAGQAAPEWSDLSFWDVILAQ
jgi:hypothetical protein